MAKTQRLFGVKIYDLLKRQTKQLVPFAATRCIGTMVVSSFRSVATFSTITQRALSLLVSVLEPDVIQTFIFRCWRRK